MINLFQLFFLLFALLAIARDVVQIQKGKLSRSQGFGWFLFWLMAGTAVLIPNAITIIANNLGIGRGADLVTYVSLAVIFFLLFRLQIKLERQRQEITALTRALALKEVMEVDVSRSTN